MKTKRKHSRKLEQDPILNRPLNTIHPSPENEKLYHPVNPDDPEIIELAESIQEIGIQEPLVITRDGWIISGHRRHTAAEVAGLKTVPGRVHPKIERNGDPDAFIRALCEFNRQRVKSHDEMLREAIVTTDPEEAYDSLLDYRRKRSSVTANTIELRDTKQRAASPTASTRMI